MDLNRKYHNEFPTFINWAELSSEFYIRDSYRLYRQDTKNYEIYYNMFCYSGPNRSNKTFLAYKLLQPSNTCVLLATMPRPDDYSLFHFHRYGKVLRYTNAGSVYYPKDIRSRVVWRDKCKKDGQLIQANTQEKS